MHRCRTDLRNKIEAETQNTVNITKDNIMRKLKSIYDWTGAGPHKSQDFGLKHFTAEHEVLATVLNECIEMENAQDDWLK